MATKLSKTQSNLLSDIKHYFASNKEAEFYELLTDNKNRNLPKESTLISLQEKGYIKYKRIPYYQRDGLNKLFQITL